MKKQTVRKDRELYRDAAAPVEDRVRDLLERMSLDEKLAQMSQRDARAFMENGRVTGAEAAAAVRQRGWSALSFERIHQPVD